MRPEDLRGSDRELFDMWRSLGLSEASAMEATVDDDQLADDASFVRVMTKLGISEAGTESWLRELGPPSLPTRSSVPLQESAAAVVLRESAAVAGRGQHYRAKLIAGDVLGSSGYYSRQVLEASRGQFAAGTKVYVDHPSVSEAYERPERSVRDLAGRLSSGATYEGDGLYASLEVYPHMAPVIEAMRGDIGLSIRAEGSVRQGTVNGRSVPVVESIDKVFSVDFVTVAGAGGRIV